MRKLTPLSLPTVNPYVRRRRYGKAIWLIRHNEWYQLDRTSDHVWSSCEEAKCFGESVRSLSAFKNCSLADSIAATVLSLMLFETHGLVTSIRTHPARRRHGRSGKYQ